MDDQVKNILKTSYLNQNEARNQFQQMGFIYDKDLSTNDSKVFVDKKAILTSYFVEQFLAEPKI